MGTLKQKILFTKEECDSIIDIYSNLPIDGSTNESDMSYIYRNVNYGIHGWIIERFKKWIEIETNSKIDWLASERNEFYFQSYTTGNKFAKHHDCRHDRVYAVGLLLNNTFNGGEFLVDVDENTSVVFDNIIGNCYFFESKIEHELKEIMSGIRHVILVFFLKKQVKFNNDKLF